MFSNPLLLSRRRCYRRLRLRQLPGCRYRLLCLLAGCRSLRPSPSACWRASAVAASIHACCTAAAFAFASATTCACCRASPSPAAVLPLSSPPSTPVAGLLPSLSPPRPLAPVSGLLPPPPPPAAELLPPLPPSSVWLPFLPCNCLCILQARQRTNVRRFVLAVKSRRERFAGANRNRSGLATTGNSAAVKKLLS